MKIIRSDKLNIKVNSTLQQEALEGTLSVYRHYVRDLMILINARWRYFQHFSGNDIVQGIEQLIHPTNARPEIKHRYFHRRYYKFPSYLRRVAIMDAAGQVKSFNTRFDDWLDNGMKNKPPKLTCSTSTFPSLYDKQCIKFNSDFKTAAIKVYINNDWIWQLFTLSGNTRFLSKGDRLSPLLVLKNKKWSLSVPTKLNKQQKDKSQFSEKLLSVDVGINTAATCAIVDKEGTVSYRAFFDRADKDRVYHLMQRIRTTAKKATRHGNKLPSGFCQNDHRRLRQINRNEVNQISRKIVDLAYENNCDAIVLEDLKYWRPSAGRKRSNMKMKFHLWFHRHLANAITSKAHELGIRVINVYARGTSSFAYDGSGKVRRDKANYANATFSTGKRYNADLNAAYNIATRGIIKLYYPSLCKKQWSQGKQNACPTTGSPLVLSSLWLLALPKAS